MMVAFDHALRMVEAHAERRSPAAVVAGDEEAAIAELLHHLHIVLGKGAEAVIDVVGAGLGQRGIAIAAQIGQHDVVALRQLCRDLVPRHVALGIAVHQQQRRTRAAMAHADDGAARLHVEMLESREQGRDFGGAPAVRIAHIIGGRCNGRLILCESLSANRAGHRRARRQAPGTCSGGSDRHRPAVRTGYYRSSRRQSAPLARKRGLGGGLSEFQQQPSFR